MVLKDLHIVIYSPLHNAGGGRETWLNMFLPELYVQTEGKCDVTVYFFSDKELCELLDVVTDRRFNFVTINTPYKKNLIGNIRRLLKFIVVTFLFLRKKTCKHSVVISVGNFYDPIPVFLAQLFNKTNKKFCSIVWLRTIWEYQMKILKSGKFSKFSLPIERLFLNHSHVIANGWDTADYYSKKGIDSFVIPNAVQIERFNTGCPLKNDPDKIIISYIGRLSAEKGVRAFIKSAEIFNRNFPDVNNVYFEIVGDGPLRQEIENVKFTNLTYMGAIVNADIPEYLNRIQIGVALTYNSGMGSGGGGVSNQLLELMAAGKIIIAWDNYTFNQVIDNNCAVLVKAGDVDAFANSYKQILDEYDIYAQKAQKAQSLAHKYSIQEHVRCFISYIDSIK